MLDEPNWVQSCNSAGVGVGVLTAGAGYRLRELAQKEEGHERYLTKARIGR